MTEFSFKANSSTRSKQFISGLVLNSPIYSFPPPDKLHFIPMTDSDTRAARQAWDEIIKFHDELRAADWEPTRLHMGSQ
jgi:hypothetical protein